MDRIDIKLLKIIQDDFPITFRPYEVIGGMLGISEEETIKRVKDLFSQNVIRKIRPSFNNKKIGYFSTLVGLKVPEDKLNKIAKKINKYKEVTHNYSREHKYNLWFTITSSSKNRIKEILNEVKKLVGTENVRNFPAKRMFKIKVIFNDIE